VRRIAIFLLAVPLLLAAPPSRIVSTAPSITESLFALGLGGRVVGVSTYCHYPPETASLPKVGTYLRPNVERIAGLKPDLVILLKQPQGVEEQLRRIALPVLLVEHGDLERMFAAIGAIGEAAGVAARARELTGRIRARLDEIQARTRNRPRRSLLFVVGRTPGRLEGLIAVGRGSYLNAIIDIAGGRNVLADSPVDYPKISLETVLARNPDVIVDMGEMAETKGVTEERKQQVVALWRQRSSLQAVAAGRVYAVASDIFVVPGPRVVEAAEAFARMLHPEAGW
jgi:iron complex transport system substrate-binding protein